MKKSIFILFLIGTVFLGFQSIEVQASRLPLVWTVGDETLTEGQPSKDGTIKWEYSDGTAYSGILTLNNYHGGKISVDCRGTCTGASIAINMIGENSIPVAIGEGMVSPLNVVFIGDGSLTINPPVANGDNAGTTKNETEKETDKKDENETIKDKEDNISKSDYKNDLYFVLTIVFGILFVITFISTIVLLAKQKNSNRF